MNKVEFNLVCDYIDNYVKDALENDYKANPERVMNHFQISEENKPSIEDYIKTSEQLAFYQKILLKKSPANYSRILKNSALGWFSGLTMPDSEASLYTALTTTVITVYDEVRKSGYNLAAPLTYTFFGGLTGEIFSDEASYTLAIAGGVLGTIQSWFSQRKRKKTKLRNIDRKLAEFADEKTAVREKLLENIIANNL